MGPLFFFHCSVYQRANADAAVPIPGEERRLRLGADAGHRGVRIAGLEAASHRLRAQLSEVITFERHCQIAKRLSSFSLFSLFSLPIWRCSGIEEQDEILSASQALALGHDAVNPVSATAPVRKDIPSERVPQKMTAKLFVNKTPEMNEGFLMPAKFTPTSGGSQRKLAPTLKVELSDWFSIAALKEELDDLTHLAPVAGDVCIPLEVTPITFPDFFDSEELTPELLDCLPLAGFELPLLDAAHHDAVDCDGEEPSPPSATPSAIKEDPFIFFNNQVPAASNSGDLFVHLPRQVRSLFD